MKRQLGLCSFEIPAEHQLPIRSIGTRDARYPEYAECSSSFEGQLSQM